MLLDPEKYQGKSFTCATAFYTPTQLVEGWTKVTGKHVTYEQVGLEEAIANLTEGMKEELKGSKSAMDEYGYFGLTGQNDLEWTLKQMEEEPTTWENFVRRHEPWFTDA